VRISAVLAVILTGGQSTGSHARTRSNVRSSKADLKTDSKPAKLRQVQKASTTVRYRSGLGLYPLRYLQKVYAIERVRKL